MDIKSNIIPLYRNDDDLLQQNIRLHRVTHEQRDIIHNQDRIIKLQNEELRELRELKDFIFKPRGKDERPN